MPPVTAALVAAGVYGFLPESLLLGPRVVIPVLLGVLLVGLVATTRARARAWARRISIALSAVIIVANLVALGQLVAGLGSPASGQAMLVGAMQVWVTGVIGFALLYWEIDRGGPVWRATQPRDRLPLADWRFSQDENDDAIGEIGDGSSEKADWAPLFVDYLYLSITNSSAFSPTDTMPLSTRAKLLMALQSTAALLTSLLVVARAVGTISGG